MVVAFLFNGSEARASDFDVICEATSKRRRMTAPKRLSTYAPAASYCGGSVRGPWKFIERWSLSDSAMAIPSATIRMFARSWPLRSLILSALNITTWNQRYLPWTLLRHSVECVTVSELTHTCADAIHIELKQNVAGYMGCFEVDRGDPLALELAANGLIPFCRYLRGILQWIVPFDHDPKLKPDISWAQNLPSRPSN